MALDEQQGGRLVIGVDGGQTKTLTVLITEHGEILGVGVSGPCNHIHELGGLERQYSALRLGYERAFASANRPPGKLAAVYCGLTGSGAPDVVRRVYETDRLVLKGDTITALAGAFPSMVGTIIIAGTGSNAMGQNAAGMTWTAGGMGYYLGDEGSGADIARLAFRAVYQANDGRSAPTALSAMIVEHYGCEDLAQLRRKVYSGDLNRDQLAQASALVGAAAADGDEVAASILREAGGELGKAVSAVLDHIAEAGQPAAVAPIGSVFKAGDLITEPMMRRVHERHPAAHLTAPRFGPAIGAALLGLREIAVEIDDRVIANLSDSVFRLETPYGG